MFISVKEFLQEVEQSIKRYFPSAKVELNEFNVLRLKVRVMITSSLFIDIFYGYRKRRVDFALIKDKDRIFGIDNLDNWHYHPIEYPERHEKTPEMSIEQIMKKFERIINELKEK
ncbi:MAG: hypothetical protein A3G93_00050 [Nitrospinae bacterium RIFCSPLOWO2_12_FULL_45_22]|nr:MAG: hypothetical protein A3G93_00050 [Nitrospinae bacterium RIFCSPLOWO2_12_FULL_45_22]